MFRFSALLASLLLMTACAHVSQQDCLEKDWKAVGYSDGAAGVAYRNLDMVTKSCSRFEMQEPPAQQYEIGYKSGLQNYCFKWKDAGERDGQRGEFRLNMEKPDFTCRRIEMPTPPSVSYESGYVLGLAKFCTADRGLETGRAGSQPPKVCTQSGASFPELLRSWEKGVKDFCSNEKGLGAGQEGYERHAICEAGKHPNYFKGFEQGARNYCSEPRRAFVRGKSGQSAFSHCPFPEASSFNAAYEEGARLKASIDSLRRQISNIQSRISDLRSNESTNAYRIRSARSDIDSLKSQIDSRRYDIRRAEDEMDSVRRYDHDDDSRSRRLRALDDRLRNFRDDIDSLERKRSELTNEDLPRFYNRQTQINFEITQLEIQNSGLKTSLVKLEAKDYHP